MLSHWPAPPFFLLDMADVACWCQWILFCGSYAASASCGVGVRCNTGVNPWSAYCEGCAYVRESVAVWCQHPRVFRPRVIGTGLVRADPEINCQSNALLLLLPVACRAVSFALCKARIIRTWRLPTSGPMWVVHARRRDGMHDLCEIRCLHCSGSKCNGSVRPDASHASDLKCMAVRIMVNALKLT